MDEPFAIRVPKRLQKRFRAKYQKLPRGKTQADLFRDMLNAHDIMSREPLQKAPQTAPKASKRASKRVAGVREGGAE